MGTNPIPGERRRTDRKHSTFARRFFLRADRRRLAWGRFARAPATPAPRGWTRTLRFLAAALLPFLAGLMQWTYWPLVRPLTWILFYPAVFFSSWIGGTWAGLLATLEAAALGWFFFMPTEGSFAVEGLRNIVTVGLFAGTGVLFSLVHGRLRRVAQALRVASEDLETLFEQAAESIFVADLSGRCADVNSAGCRLLGLSREEIVGKTIYDMIPPEQSARLEEAQELLLKTGSVQVAEWDLKRSDGSLVPVEISASILPDGRWQAFVRDVSERKRAEDALRRLAEVQRRDEFQKAFEAAANAMMMVDSRGRIVLTNAEADRLFGYPKGELDGRIIEVLVPARFKAAHPAHREAFLEEPDGKRGMGRGRDLWGLRKDGSEFPVEIGLTRVRLEDATFVVTSIRDISERKTFEQKLRDSEERFRQLVQNVKDYAIFMHDEDGKVTVWNEGAERILGYRAEEIIGRHFSAFSTPEDTADGRPARGLKAAVERGSLQIDEWRVRKDGSRFLANVVITPVYGRDGKLAGYGNVIRDLTEMKKAEDALKGSDASLGRIVKELEGFAYTASHDLRSPVRAIQGYAHFARQRLQDCGDPESLDMLQRIGDSAVRLDRLIRDVLSYSAISRGDVALAPVDLDKVVAHVVGLDPSLEKARPKVRTPLGAVMAQESLMIQIVSNLLANAVKFVPSGRAPEIDVWTERREGGKLRLIVQDNGTGIPREHLKRLFEPFARLAGARGLEGTGIGLAIVKRAVERLGGAVGVESETGKGSRFTVELAEAGHAD